MRNLTVLLALLLAAPAGAVEADGAAPAPRPGAVVLMIGDGLGPAQVTFARALVFGPGGGRFAFESMPVVGLMTTWSASNAVTDSSAAATAMAAGVKTDNRFVGLDAAGTPVRTLADAARDAGWRVGLVTTTTVVHATPASFYAHVGDRYAYDSIAGQLAADPLDLVLGGGLGHFLPEAAGGGREDGCDAAAAAEARGTTVLRPGDPLPRPAPRPLLGLLARWHLAHVLDDRERPPAEREPTLAELTRFALDALGGGDRPFFLLVEGGRIDHAGHAFDAAGVALETAAFDEAVAAVLAFRDARPDTLVVLTADHATGGLAINDYVDWDAIRRQRASVERMTDEVRDDGRDAAWLDAAAGLPGHFTAADVAAVRDAPDVYEARRRLGRRLADAQGVTWLPRVGGDGTTRGHTGDDVLVFAAGPGAERFRGLLDNTEIAAGVAGLLGWRVGLDPAAPFPAADACAVAASP